MLIRFFQSGDEEGVIGLVKKIFLEFGETFSPETLDRDIMNISTFYFEKGGVFWVLLEGDKIIGTGGITPINKDVCKFRRFYLNKDFRRMGYGRKLYNVILEYCRDKGYKEIWLSTTPSFKAATLFYEKVGFEKSLKPLWPYKRAPLFYTLKLY